MPRIEPGTAAPQARTSPPTPLPLSNNPAGLRLERPLFLPLDLYPLKSFLSACLLGNLVFENLLIHFLDHLRSTGKHPGHQEHQDHAPTGLTFAFLLGRAL